MFLSSITGFAQGADLRNSKRYFYGQTGIDFVSSIYGGGQPTTFDVSSISGFYSSYGRIGASVCDKEGNPLLIVQNYFISVYNNGAFNVIPDPILSSSDPHGVIIVPRPKYADRYYVVTSSEESGLFFSEVDLTNLVLINKNRPLKDPSGNPILSSTGGFGVSSTTHQNGTDYWITAFVNDTLFSYQVTENGINALPTSFIDLPVASDVPIPYMYYNYTHSVKISPQTGSGKRIAVVNSYTGVSLKNFNDGTGEISESDSYTSTTLQQIGQQNLNYGIFTKDVEFSPEGNVMYYVDYEGAIYAVHESGYVSAVSQSAGFISSTQGSDGFVYFVDRWGYVSRSDYWDYPDCIENTSIDRLFEGQTDYLPLPQLVSINDCLATAVTPTFHDFAWIGNDTSYSLPTTSIEGITGTWNPSALSEGEHAYTFIPSASNVQCANPASMSFIFLQPKTIVANDDNFYATPINPYATGPTLTASVFDNDFIDYGDTVTMNNVTVSFVSMNDANSFVTMSGGWLPTIPRMGK
ncbi:MAG: hypothetical protein ACI7YS_13985 [Flavobacterium sp.]